MPFTNLNLITVTGKFLLLSGSAGSGTVVFTPSTVLTDMSANEIIEPTPFTATLNGSGAISIQLPATNDPDLTPIGWTYTVEEHITGSLINRTYLIQIPWNAAGATIDLADITPVVIPPLVESYALSTDPKFAGQRGNRVIYIGDSITFGDSDSSNPDYIGERDFPGWAEKLSNSKILRYRNAGLGGNDSINLLANLTNTVLQYASQIGWCVIMCGTNDAYFANIGTAGYTFATYKANMAAVVERLRTFNIKPVLCTITPRDTASSPLGLRQNIEKYNVWLREWSAVKGVPLVDMRPALIDPATNQIKTEFAGDGLHPGDWGNLAMGQVVADTLSPLFTPWAPPLADYEGDATANMVTGGLFLVDSNADGVGNSWDTSYMVGVGSRVDPTDPNAIKGKWQRITAQGNDNIFQSLPSSGVSPKGWSVGDRLAICGWCEFDGPVGGGLGSIAIFLNGFATAVYPIGIPMANQTTNKHIGPFRFYREWTIPVGTTSIELWLSHYGGGSTAVGWVQFAQVTVINLTRLESVIS